MVIARNLRLLGTQAKHLHFHELLGIHTNVVQVIAETMAVRVTEFGWFEAAFSGDGASARAQEIYEHKRFDRDRLQPLFGQAGRSPSALLRRVVDGREKQPTVLEEKLLAGGADDETVKMARLLRANSLVREYEDYYSSLYDRSAILEDVRVRLEYRHRSLVSQHGQSPAPAMSVWNELVRQLPGWASIVDRQGLFGCDDALLLGEICEMAELCRIDWGVADA
jgi:hypothetical protein